MSLTPVGPRYGYARALRREIIFRSQKMVKTHAIAASSSYGPEGAVVYSSPEDGTSHGNFFPQSYAAILSVSAWRKRLSKVHPGRRYFPRDGRWCELDSCTSSDALLMNIFCHPGALAAGKLHKLMNVDLTARPEFGVRMAAPLKNGHRDRTEADMRLGDLLVEAKLTESDFQRCDEDMIERYREFAETFDRALLALVEGSYESYQLLRSVLAAQASGARFCVIIDERRPDLREQWFAVMRCVRNYELRLRCQMLTWQEISVTLPHGLRGWLEEKYGIFAPGTAPQIDAEEWYW